jgi:cysteine synthase A
MTLVPTESPRDVDADILKPGFRRKLYERLKRSIGNTPLFPLEGIDVGRNCKVYVKAEYLNPSGSHYDREMVRLLESLEANRLIQPGVTQMLETTTGNSGSSFAWLCRVLGYPPPSIVIPSDMPRSRRRQIASFGAHLIESASGQYISGIEDSFGAIYTAQKDRPPEEKFYCPKHWDDEFHCIAGMHECGLEIVRQVEELGIELDCFVFALGNGSSARGVGEILRPRGVTLYGMEPSESPIVAEMQQRVGFEIALPIAGRQHGILGTGPSEQRQVYKNMRVAAEMLKDITHVSTSEAAEMQIELMDRAFLHIGMSSAACIVGIRKLVEKHGLRHQNIGTIFYDSAWKYLD